MLEGIDTPALLLDVQKLERNCAGMRERVSGKGTMLRPHVKTAKCVEVTRIALGAASGPITVSTLREAEEFFANGFTISCMRSAWCLRRSRASQTSSAVARR